jgi:cell division protein FtsI/penicillin-binding protein 2
MITSDNIHIRNIMNSKEGTNQYDIKSYILSCDKAAADDLEKARELFLQGFTNGAFSQGKLILVMYEQGLINDDDGVITKVKQGTMSGATALITKLQREGGDITPQMTGMDPCTGSVVVTDVNNGGVLAAVTYPSYDNNELVNDFNNEYYLKLQNDPTTPMVNRPFTEPRAPGSTFKMITATAALEEGYITPHTTITDKGTFKDAGLPYAKCWIGSGLGSHGTINVSNALEVSCNYFFYTVAYMMGNNNPNSLQGIQTLNKYMKAFGLDDKTGVEIYELYDSLEDYPTRIASPDYQKYVALKRDSNASASDYKWTAGDTIRTAIGQSCNNYTSAIMSKYIATLANGGTRYKMHFLDSVVDSNGAQVEKYSAVVENQLNIKKENLDAIFNGMLLVTKGESGTLRKVFSDYSVNVAAKSGTAQQSTKRSEHTTFVAFAPYEDPQISIAIFIPFGNGDTSPAPKVAKSVISEYLKLDIVPQTKKYNLLLH